MAELVQVLNEIRAHASADYQRNVPVAVRENLQQVADVVMNSQTLQNDYVAAIVNRISGERYTSRRYNDQFQKFRKGTNRYGTTIEEIYVNMANAHEYNPAIAENEVYKRVIPDVNAVFHRRNSKIFYKDTIQYDSLYASFLSEGGMRSLVAQIVDQMYGANNRDQFYQTKALMSGNAPYFYQVNVPAVSAENANSIVTTIRTMSNMLTFPSNLYNHYGVTNFTPKERQVLILRADVAAVVDVNSLAMAFNLQYRDFMAGTYMITDDFGDDMENCVGLLVDDEFFQIYDNLIKFTENYNGQGLNWQYFLHHWATYSVSPFSNAIMFTTATLTPATAIAITPNSAEMGKDDTQVFEASVTPATASQAVRWSVSGGTQADTYITATGLLHVGVEENASTLTVTATSVQTPTITQTATVTLS